MLEPGDKAPIFSLPDADMERVNLETLLGKKNLIIYFYPKDDTPGCTMEALDFVSVVLEGRDFAKASSALVTELAGRLGCDQVGLGVVRRKRCKVVALSHVSGFGSRMNLVRDLGLAMDDQTALVGELLSTVQSFK